jgi:hypothetical protein
MEWNVGEHWWGALSVELHAQQTGINCSVAAHWLHHAACAQLSTRCWPCEHVARALSRSDSWPVAYLQCVPPPPACCVPAGGMPVHMDGCLCQQAP